nr:hemerythrin domain-containing protein [Polymorphobacter sp.]
MATKYKARSNNDSSGGKFAAGAAGFGLGLLAAVGRRAAVQAITAVAGDWFDGLKAEHKLAMTLMEAMEKTSEADVKKRAAMLLSLQHMLGKHAIQEEDVIYCALRALGDVNDANELGNEHNAEVKQGLYDLEQIDKASPAWVARLTQLKNDIAAHVQKEEDEVFPKLRAKLTPEENKKLTVRMNFEGFKVA